MLRHDAKSKDRARRERRFLVQVVIDGRPAQDGMIELAFDAPKKSAQSISRVAMRIFDEVNGGKVLNGALRRRVSSEQPKEPKE